VISLPIGPPRVNPLPWHPVAPGLRPSGVRVVWSGVDWLTIGIYGRPGQDALSSLLDLRSHAEETGEEPEVETADGETWCVGAHGARPCWSVLMRGPLGVLRVSTGAYHEVQLSAWALTHHGPRWAMDLAARWAAWLCGETAELKLKRLDVAVDTQGLFEGVPLPTDPRVSCRAEDWSSHGKGEHVETLTRGKVGTGIQVCIYDKTREILTSGKAWLATWWAAAGYDAATPVIRVEGRLQGERLAEVLEGGDGASAASADDVERSARLVASHAFRDFLTWRVRTSDSNRSRWPICPRWLEATDAGGAPAHRAPVHLVAAHARAVAAEGQVVRAVRSPEQHAQLVAQLAGVVSTLAAGLGGAEGLEHAPGEGLRGEALRQAVQQVWSEAAPRICLVRGGARAAARRWWAETGWARQVAAARRPLLCGGGSGEGPGQGGEPGHEVGEG